MNPLLPHEQDQLHRLRTAIAAAPERVRQALLGEDNIDHYSWFTPSRPILEQTNG